MKSRRSFLLYLIAALIFTGCNSQYKELGTPNLNEPSLTLRVNRSSDSEQQSQSFTLKRLVISRDRVSFLEVNENEGEDMFDFKKAHEGKRLDVLVYGVSVGVLDLRRGVYGEEGSSERIWFNTDHEEYLYKLLKKEGINVEIHDQAMDLL